MSNMNWALFDWGLLEDLKQVLLCCFGEEKEKKR